MAGKVSAVERCFFNNTVDMSRGMAQCSSWIRPLWVSSGRLSNHSRDRSQSRFGFIRGHRPVDGRALLGT